MANKKKEENRLTSMIVVVLILLAGLALVNTNNDNVEDPVDDGNENIERYDREKKHGSCINLPEQRAMGFRCECYQLSYIIYDDLAETGHKDPNYVKDSPYWPNTICDCWYTYDLPVHAEGIE